ncbi:hypothetical protein Pcinc_043080 [Petrolisthes cinctipes]|uniref:Uncharacterized protein n=1 Tax=Petrolisthes cinctipes TaxID=88211 RepID=A0AAE1EI82_PETCI|nr:hypothetical protein Pcinc_043080 [Petrolisthes cinctipes]
MQRVRVKEEEGGKGSEERRKREAESEKKASRGSQGVRGREEEGGRGSEEKRKRESRGERMGRRGRQRSIQRCKSLRNRSKKLLGFGEVVERELVGWWEGGGEGVSGGVVG